MKVYYFSKGALLGAISVLLLRYLFPTSGLELYAIGLVGTAVASYVAMNFTGSSTYTSYSGVLKEMKWSIPFQIAFTFIGFVLFIYSKLN